jgi:serine protease
MRKYLAVAAGAALAAVLGMTAPAMASPPAGGAAPPGIAGTVKTFFPVRNHGAIPDLGGGNLTYHGGPVQSSPHVYLVFWGKWWKSGCTGQLGHGLADENYLKAFFNGRGTSGDQLSKVLTQYSGTHFTGDVLFGSAFNCSNPPQAATQSQLGAVAASYASVLRAGGKTVDKNTQIVVVSPSGTNPGGGFGSQYCAWHSYAISGSLKLSYTNLPYLPDQGANCGAGIIPSGPSPALQGWPIVAGHEFAESVNDPQISAWYDNQGYEIGDKCAWTGIYVQALPTGHFVEQPEWSNTYSTCLTEF